MTEFLSPESAEYAFGTSAHGWSGFVVVDVHGVEAISEPFHYLVSLIRRPNEAVPLESLLDVDATLAFAAHQAQPGFFVRHGVIERAVELERTTSFHLYQVVLRPTFWRARYRQRCRTFVDHTLREIVDAVLKNESPAHPGGFEGLAPIDTDPGRPELLGRPAGAVAPVATYRWDVRDHVTVSRLDDRSLRKFTAQYNESDYDFVARLLEEEGIGYFFEHDAGGSTMWLCDTPGRQSLFADRRDPQAVRFEGHSSGLGIGREQVVWGFHESMAMRPRAVTMRDWSWTRSHVVLEGRAQASSGDEDHAGHFEFPGRDDGRLKEPCIHPADVRLERFAAEAELRHGRSNLRGLAAGRRILISDHGGADGHLVTRVELAAVQLELERSALDDLPFGFDGRSARNRRAHEARFDALPAEVRFRPAMVTRKPRIDGVQSAIVTAESGATKPPPEIHSDEFGRVRVRFPWDQRADGKPSSHWLRVSHQWAGAGFGGLYTPRVGQEVLVAFVGGDPERPVVVGRVYNATHPLPIPDYDQHLEQSTIRSQSTPRATGYNEILFDDRHHHECIRVHAQRNMDETILGAHSVSVGGDQSTTVGGNQTNTVEKDHTHHAKGNHHHNVDGDHDDYVIGHITTISGGFHRDYAAANREIRATNFYVETGPSQNGMAGDLQLKSGTMALHQQQAFEAHAPTWGVHNRESFEVRVGTAFIRVLPGLIELNTGAGAVLHLTGATIVAKAAGDLTAIASTIHLNP
jgi:type VI secretion system secreted protein VgrG